MGFSRQEYWSGVPLPSPLQTALLYSFNPHISPVKEGLFLSPMYTWARRGTKWLRDWGHTNKWGAEQGFRPPYGPLLFLSVSLCLCLSMLMCMSVCVLFFVCVSPPLSFLHLHTHTHIPHLSSGLSSLHLFVNICFQRVVWKDVKGWGSLTRKRARELVKPDLINCSQLLSTHSVPGAVLS